MGDGGWETGNADVRESAAEIITFLFKGMCLFYVMALLALRVVN